MAVSSPSNGEDCTETRRSPGDSTRGKEDDAGEGRAVGGGSGQASLDAREAAEGSGDGDGDQLNQQLDWAPAAQATFDISDYDDLPDVQEALQDIEEKRSEMDEGEANDDVGGAKRTQKVSDSDDNQDSPCVCCRHSACSTLIPQLSLPVKDKLLT